MAQGLKRYLFCCGGNFFVVLSSNITEKIFCRTMVTDTKALPDFNTLLEQYGSIINKVCYFYARDIDEFHDLRQDALLNIWQGLEYFHNKSSVSTWIYRVAFNSCVSNFRKNKHNAKSEPIEYHPEIIADNDEKASMVRELYSLINRLGAIDKAIILMWLDENDYQAIAEVIGLNKSTIGTRIHRIKEKLVKLSNK